MSAPLAPAPPGLAGRNAAQTLFDAAAEDLAGELADDLPEALADGDGSTAAADAKGPGAEPEATEWREAVLGAAQHGLRLDKALVGLAPEFSRSHLQGLIERGHVRLDGQVQTTASRKLRVGQRLRVELVDSAESQAFRPEAMDLAIVHEDAHLLVINKPAGLVVHPAAGHWSGTLLNGLLAHHACAASLPRAGIVHRLDKDTSGLMVVAKTLPAMTMLVRQIAVREVKRVYLALAHGMPAWQVATIDAPIARDPYARLRMAVVAGGKPARTEVECLGTLRGSAQASQAQTTSALRCRLHTGRTHQIRVHLSHRGHPLLADTLYGGTPGLGMARQALHATELAFAHPHDGRLASFHAALPPDMATAWARVMPA